MSGKNRLMAGLLYDSGLRLMELAGVKIKEKDIDFAANTINFRSGRETKTAQLFC
jgi:site-specific recombinase XerC